MTTAGPCLFNYFFSPALSESKKTKSFFRLLNLPLKRLRTVDDLRIYRFTICLNFFLVTFNALEMSTARSACYSHNFSSTHRQPGMDIKKLFPYSLTSPYEDFQLKSYTDLLSFRRTSKTHVVRFIILCDSPSELLFQTFDAASDINFLLSVSHFLLSVWQKSIITRIIYQERRQTEWNDIKSLADDIKSFPDKFFFSSSSFLWFIQAGLKMFIEEEKLFNGSHNGWRNRVFCVCVC